MITGTLLAPILTSCGDDTTTASSSFTFPAVLSGYHALSPTTTGKGSISRPIPRGNASIAVVASCVGAGDFKITFGENGGGLSFPCDPKGHFEYVTAAVSTSVDPNATTLNLATASDNTWRIQVSGSPHSS